MRKKRLIKKRFLNFRHFGRFRASTTHQTVVPRLQFNGKDVGSPVVAQRQISNEPGKTPPKQFLDSVDIPVAAQRQAPKL